MLASLPAEMQPCGRVATIVCQARRRERHSRYPGPRGDNPPNHIGPFVTNPPQNGSTIVFHGLKNLVSTVYPITGSTPGSESRRLGMPIPGAGYGEMPPDGGGFVHQIGTPSMRLARARSRSAALRSTESERPGRRCASPPERTACPGALFWSAGPSTR